MAYQHWSYDTLHRLCMEAFQKFGFTEAEADIIQDVLLMPTCTASSPTVCSGWSATTSASKKA